MTTLCLISVADIGSAPGPEANESINCTARPTTQLAPFRAAAAISSSSRKDASGAAVQPHGGYGLAGRERKEVPLPSQEPTKGLVQYALYVSLPTLIAGGSHDWPGV